MYLTGVLMRMFNFISHSASGPIIKRILQSCLRKHNGKIEESVV